LRLVLEMLVNLLKTTRPFNAIDKMTHIKPR
jgi:hypothetical protein